MVNIADEGEKSPIAPDDKNEDKAEDVSDSRCMLTKAVSDLALRPRLVKFKDNEIAPAESGAKFVTLMRVTPYRADSASQPSASTKRTGGGHSGTDADED